MRWGLLIAVFGLSIADVASFAEGPPEDQSLAATRSSLQDAGFFASSGMVRFQLIQGRLCLDAPRHRKGSQQRDEAGVYESITVTAERGIPSMHYVFQTPEHHLTLSVQNAETVRIESWFPQSSQRCVLDQPALGAITWLSQRGDLQEQYHGPTLLHLRHSDPASFDQHFGSLAERVLRGNSLEALSEATQARLLGGIADSAAPDARSIHECIDQLRSNNRASRIKAERQLLAWGAPIIPTIQRLPRGELDNEQLDRLSSVLRRLRPREDDTPASLAALLVCDPSYWSAIAAGLSQGQLQLANDHLRRFGAAPITIAERPEHRIAAARE